jgi:hypothetical protein
LTSGGFKNKSPQNVFKYLPISEFLFLYSLTRPNDWIFLNHACPKWNQHDGQTLFKAT